MSITHTENIEEGIHFYLFDVLDSIQQSATASRGARARRWSCESYRIEVKKTQKKEEFFPDHLPLLF